MMLKAHLTKDTGLADHTRAEYVTIVDFVFGEHFDGAKYGRSAQCAQAICLHSDGRFGAYPITWLTVGRLTVREARNDAP